MRRRVRRNYENPGVSTSFFGMRFFKITIPFFPVFLANSNPSVQKHVRLILWDFHTGKRILRLVDHREFHVLKVSYKLRKLLHQENDVFAKIRSSFKKFHFFSYSCFLQKITLAVTIPSIGLTNATFTRLPANVYDICVTINYFSLKKSSFDCPPFQLEIEFRQQFRGFFHLSIFF